jgi:ribonuclease BN (tRNA processing enzyme)
MSKERAGKPAAGGPEESARATLPLTNDGSLDLTFIGAGGAFSKKFFQNNLLVVKGESHLMVDCGSRAPEALSQLGLSATSIRNFLITHSHADHIGGLEEVMLLNRYVTRTKPTIIASPRLRQILWTMSLRGGCAWNESHEGKPLEFEDFWESATPKRLRGEDRELAEIELGGMRLSLFRTMHIPDNAAGWEDSFPSYGLVIDRRVLFTSDTRYDPSLISWAEGLWPLEAIFHDCQLYTGGVHASLEEIAAFPPAIRAKTWLMHYGDKIDDFRSRIAELGFAGVVDQWSSWRFR